MCGQLAHKNRVCVLTLADHCLFSDGTLLKLNLKMPHVPNTGGVEHRLTDYVAGLKNKLENVEIGKYEKIRE
jgi:hypothetical protein